MRDSNEDLNAQLMSHCVEEGKSLLKSGNGKSLAEELEHLTKEEVSHYFLSIFCLTVLQLLH